VLAHDGQLGAGGVIGIKLADVVEQFAADTVVEELAGQRRRVFRQGGDGIGDEVAVGRVQVEQAWRSRGESGDDGSPDGVSMREG